jgi:protein-L-isoaspartate(D-aspartate) O-methyltransferase
MGEAALATQAQDIKERSDATAVLRRTMVDRQLRPFDVTDVPLLQRFLDLPRELFLPKDLGPLAYSDLPVTLRPEGRVLEAPLVLARLLQFAGVRETHKVLDIAGGAGYPAAILAGLAQEVVALESSPKLAEEARANLLAVGVSNASVETGRLEKGVVHKGPFDVIIIHGRVEQGLDDLFAQLAPNGRLIAFRKSATDGAERVVMFELSDGKPAGEIPLFDAGAPLLPDFEKPQSFVF